MIYAKKDFNLLEPFETDMGNEEYSIIFETDSASEMLSYLEDIHPASSVFDMDIFFDKQINKIYDFRTGYKEDEVNKLFKDLKGRVSK
jgi:hypothetical protein